MTPSISFDRIADDYDESRGGAKRGETMADVLERHLGPNGLIAEIGIGTGIVAAALTARDFEIVGVDLAPAMLQRANIRLPGRVATADATTLPFADASVDAAYLVWVLHVVGDPAGVVRECVRAVRPGGRLLVIPAHAWNDEHDPVEELLARLSVLRPHTPTIDDVRAWMADAGLTGMIVEHDEDHSYQAPAHAADELERRMWSSLWNLDDDRFADLVQPVIDGLRALPDPEVPRRRRHRNHVVVGSKPT